MKINDYQKVVLIWGVSLFSGYILTELNLSNLEALLLIWTVVYSVAFFFQVYLMWYLNKPVILAQATWIIASLAGGIFTYFKVVGIVDHPFRITVMWFVTAAGAMFFTMFTQKNKSYLILAAIYLVFAVLFQVIYFRYEYAISGVIFLGMAIFDALLEYSPLRKKLAEFTPAQSD